VANETFSSQFLSQVREIKPEMELGALNLIKKYFVASRRVREETSAVPRATLPAM